MDAFFEYLASLEPASVYLTLAAILVLCGLGLPIPEDISLVAAGYLAHLGVLDVHLAFVVCFASVLGGDMLAFTLGRRLGAMALESRVLRRLFPPGKQRRAREYFAKYGGRVIFAARFLPGLRFSIFFSAGSLRYRPAAFLAVDALAAALSVPALVYLAWWFGEDIDRLIGWVRHSQQGLATLAIVLVLVVGWKAWRGRALAQPGAAPTSRPEEAP